MRPSTARPIRLVLALAVPLAVGLVAGAPAHAGPTAPSGSTAEPSAEPTIKIRNRVGVQADGAGLAMSLDLTCEVGAYSSLYVFVTQVQDDGKVAHASAYADLTCTGSRQRVPVAALAQSADGSGERAIPVRAGSAFASARVETCGEFDCEYAAVERAVVATDTRMQAPRHELPGLTFELLSAGELLADGAGAVTHVRYTCDAGTTGSIDGVLAQVAEDGLVGVAGASFDIDCSESSRSGVLAFHAYGAAWHRGRALLVGAGLSCGPDECELATGYRTVRLR